MKVGYSLLLGHEANPPDLWLGSCSQTPSAATNTLLSLTACRTRLLVSKSTGSPEKLSHSGNTQTAAPSVRLSVLRPNAAPSSRSATFLRLVPELLRRCRLGYAAASERRAGPDVFALRTSRVVLTKKKNNR